LFCIVGAKSRSLGYWWKLKPDYDASGTVADIDLLVLGGRFAEGMDRRGLLSSLVLGCLSAEHRYGGSSAKYMVVTKVNFAKETEMVLKELTGFQRADESGEFRLGKWFESDEVPDFISSESYQREFVRDELGWKPEKKDRVSEEVSAAISRTSMTLPPFYVDLLTSSSPPPPSAFNRGRQPDVWIKPEDSFVVTINSAELQASHSMQAGFALRFPRITNIRGKESGR
jgi:ATP-dependent DNA ligase